MRFRVLLSIYFFLCYCDPWYQNDPLLGIQGWISVGPTSSVAADGSSVLWTYEKQISNVLSYTKEITDFSSISFTVYSEEEFILYVYTGEREGATFFYAQGITPQVQTPITIQPQDFEKHPTSPVEKTSLTPKDVHMGFLIIDANESPSTINTVTISNVVISLPVITQVFTSDFVHTSGKISLSESIIFQGDVYVIGSGTELALNGSRILFEKDIIVHGGGQLNMKNGFWKVPQRYNHQKKFQIAMNSHTNFVNGTMHLFFPMVFIDFVGSTSIFENINMYTSGFTLTVSPSCSVLMNKCKKMGEIIIEDGSELILHNSEHILIWNRFNSTISSEIIFPSPNEDWSPSLIFPKRSLEIVNPSEFWYGILADLHCDIKIRDSSLMALGVTFMEGKENTVDNIQNFQHYSDFTLENKNQKIQLINTEVDAWNFYTTAPGVELEITNTLFGEVLTFTNTTMKILDSQCDGSGGYVGSNDQSFLQIYFSTLNSSVIAKDDSKMQLLRCVVNGDITAGSNSVVILNGTKVNGNMIEIDNGMIIVGDYNEPDDTVISDSHMDTVVGKGDMLRISQIGLGVLILLIL